MKLKKNNVLIIGGNGFIGINLINHLHLNHNISLLIRPGKKINNNNFNDKIRIYYGEISDLDLIHNIILNDKIDTLVHLACTLIPSSNLEDFNIEITNIILPTIKLVSLISKYKIKLIYFSSGGAIYGINKSGIFNELSDTKPITYYGQAKKILEDIIFFENRLSGLKYLIIRPSNVYGVGQNIYGNQGFIGVSIGKILNDEKISIWGNGSVIRDYIYVDDLINRVVKLIENGVNNEVFNIGSGQCYSINEIVKIFKRNIPVNFEVEYLDSRKVDVPVMILDVKKLNVIVNSNKVSIEDGILNLYKHELMKKKL